MDYQQVFFLFLCGITVMVAIYVVLVRKKREERDREALKESIEANQHIPPTLYPIIQPDICIGSLSCLSACPQGDILGIIDGKAKLIEATHCIGHGRCAAECPVDAIRLVFGTSERGTDLPHVKDMFESSRPGVHVIGELGGMGLIRNASIQGIQLGQHFAKILKGDASGQDATDVAIVGAGPAGLALAMTLKASGIGSIVLEQESEGVGGTVFAYPRHKVVMTDSVDFPGYGTVGKQILSKEELVAMYNDAVQKTGIQVQWSSKVTGVEGKDGAFTVEHAKGKLKAKKVVLAIGRRGTPRKVGCPGEDLPKVTYRLIDYEQYRNSKVVVVGGGDSALEASIQLCEDAHAKVIHTHRSEAFKCRDANRKKLNELAVAKKLELHMNTSLKEIRKDSVVLKGPKEWTVPNDYVLICAGGELPTEFLNKVGVDLRLYKGEALSDNTDESSVPGHRPKPKLRPEVIAERRRERRLWFWLFIVGALVTAIMAIIGWDYYRLGRAERFHSPLHAMLKPSGPWGHGVGVVATAVMITNYFYVVRKRWKRMKRTGKIKLWMDIHAYVGFLAPVFITFHAAFQAKNQLASATALSMTVVVITGIIGRFLWGLVPAQEGGNTLEYAEVLERWEKLRERLKPFLSGLTNPAPVQRFLAAATEPIKARSLLLYMVRMPLGTMTAQRHIGLVRPLFDPDTFEDFAESFWELWRLRSAVGFYKSLKRLMSAWRLLHLSLAVFLAIMIMAHVGVEIYLGYKWIF